MTTTPTASPELPGLDNLETQARAADQDGQHIYTNPRDSDNWRANEIWHYLASPAAVLALIALARRAQPEGEAPQAEPLSEVQIDRIARAYFSEQWAVQHAKDAIHDAFEDARKSATLSPLCGAQHAESGKEVYQVFSHDSGEWYGVDKAQYDRAHDSCRRVLAAQQAAAPGSSPEIPDSSISAPGTPEAPKDERKGIELWRAMLRACGELPEGYEVRIELENGCGMAVWYDAEGERHVIDGDGYLSDDVNEAVDAAIQRAAQLDGGQEGSES